MHRLVHILLCIKLGLVAIFGSWEPVLPGKYNYKILEDQHDRKNTLF